METPLTPEERAAVDKWLRSDEIERELAEALLAVREEQPGNLHFGSPFASDLPVPIARAILAALHASREQRPLPRLPKEFRAKPGEANVSLHDDDEGERRP